MLRIRIAASAAALLVLAACGGDTVSPGTNNPPPPAAIASIEMSPTTASVQVGKTTSLAATARDAKGTTLTGRTLTWSSSSAAVAGVDANGVVTGVAAGVATITVTGEGKTATAAITVTAPTPVIPVATVTVAPALDTVEAYDPKVMTAVTRDAKDSLLTDRVIRWSSSNTAVATIDPATGALLGIDRGTVTITATSEGKTGSVSRVIVIKYRSVTAGSMHVCDIASGGFVWCWGLNGKEGRIGSATLADDAMSTSPVLVPNTGWNAQRFTQLSSYGTHTCGITTQAKAYCWGNNGWGVLGGGSNASQSSTPILVAADLSFRQISAGADHTCGVTTDDRAYCWGHNDGRQFAANTPAMSTTPFAVAPDMRFSSISAGSSYTCGITTAGASYCWGSSGLGQLGDGTKISYGNTYSVTPVAVVVSSPLRMIDASLNYTCGVSTGNQAFCWGSNGGRLGNGATGTDSSTPVAVSGGLTFASVSSGNGFSCGVTTNSQVWCWGSNDNGQLGVAGINFSTTPVRAGGSLLAAEVSAASVATGFGRHTCAISADRLSTYCFGRNETGQLGNGSTTTAVAVNPTPTIVVGQKPLP